MMHKLVPAAAMLSLVMFAACSSSLGDTPTDLLGEGVTAPISCANPDDLRMVDQCVQVPYVKSATAVEAFADLKEVATAALGDNGIWVGSIRGAGIGRDGKNVDSGLSGWTTAWFSGAVEDPDMLVFDTTGGVCRVQNRCTCITNGNCLDFESLNMTAGARPTEIAVDSAAAILEVFPTDPDGQKYDMLFDGVTGQWTVTRIGVGPDADVIDGDVPVSDGLEDVADVQVPDALLEV